MSYIPGIGQARSCGPDASPENPLQYMTLAHWVISENPEKDTSHAHAFPLKEGIPRVQTLFDQPGETCKGR